VRALGLVALALAGCSYPEFAFAPPDGEPFDAGPDTTAIDTAIGDEVDSGSLDASVEAAPDVAADVPDACACPRGEICEGTSCRQLASCAAIKAAFPTLTSNSFTIDPDGSGPRTPFRVFCEMVADGGGWTLAVKLDGKKSTFAYASALWTNDELLNPTSTDNSTTEAKFRSFLEVPFTRVRVRTFDGVTPRFFPIDVASTSLKALFSGPAITTTAGRAKWLSLVADSALQANCNAEGVNREFTTGAKIQMRLGIIANNQTDCSSPDSYLGFGVSIATTTDCFGGVDPGIVVGNLAAASCEAPKDKAVATFGFLYVR
jgi:hypothetical protein